MAKKGSGYILAVIEFLLWILDRPGFFTIGRCLGYNSVVFTRWRH